MIKNYFKSVGQNYKELFKSYTPLKIVRDLIRLFFFCSFFILAKMLHLDFEVENEYVVILSFMLFGTLWCGLFCPFGNAQYFANKFVGQIYFKNLQINIPPKVDKHLRNLKFLVFVLFIWVILRDNLFPERGYNSASYFADHVEMYQAHPVTNFIFEMKTYLVLLVPIFFSRFFCKYLCYQKVFYQILNRYFPVFKIERENETCVGCNKCNKSCSMNIDVANSKEIIGEECIGCLSCVDDCPTKINALKVKWFGIKFKPLTIMVLFFIIYMAVTLFFMYGLNQMH